MLTFLKDLIGISPKTSDLPPRDPDAAAIARAAEGFLSGIEGMIISDLHAEVRSYLNGATGAGSYLFCLLKWGTKHAKTAPHAKVLLEWTFTTPDIVALASCEMRRTKSPFAKYLDHATERAKIPPMAMPMFCLRSLAAQAA